MIYNVFGAMVNLAQINQSVAGPTAVQLVMFENLIINIFSATDFSNYFSCLHLCLSFISYA